MSDTPSINDLIHAHVDSSDDESTEGRFQKKEKEIHDRDLERLTAARAQSSGLPYIDLNGFPISQEALAMIPENEAKELEAVCFFFDGHRLRLAALDPHSSKVRQKLADLQARLFINEGEIYLVSARSLAHGLKLYDSLPKIKAMPPGVKIDEASLEKYRSEISDFRSLDAKINEVNMSDVLVLLIAAALKINSSDIHIEAEESGVIVRLRVDGTLQQAAIISRDKWHQVISRLKALAKVKINVEDKPQDGRFTILAQGEKIAVRASFLPTAFGESVVMRLLYSSAVSLSFDTLGLRPRPLSILKEEVDKPNGLILVTGPTGSGKTTTLYALLNYLNKPGTKIITLEDPIEYQLENINQSQVDESKGYSFSSGLRSVMRQDPDVVMIGEMRDLETAEISVRAALTGHLVLSTVHTNDAAGAIPRMLDLGIKSYLLTPAINAIVGQRLVRNLCPQCKAKHILTAEESSKIKKILAVISPKAEVDVPENIDTIYKPVGCEACNGLGYKGRSAIFEILVMDEKIKELANGGASGFKILQQAIENGMVTMLQDGVLKCIEGLTSLEEVYSVAGGMEYVDELYDIAVAQTIGHGITISVQQLETGKGLIKDLTANHAAVLQGLHTKEILAVVMAGGIAAGASDVNIDPEENKVKVRYRVDGILHDIASLDKEYYIPLLGEIKTSAGFPSNLKKPTLDGRFQIALPEGKLDCRVSVISGGYGETAAIRLLATEAKTLDMKKLGIVPPAFDIINSSIHKTKGIIFTSGPTGSGKTTTLYSLLNTLNEPSVKIITIEDPIEYNLPGLIQTQINTEEGYSFATALRSLLRQNPNVIMVGEIRDQETAKVAVEAALTGHLVLSTIHANSAAGAISRFVGLGIERSLLSSSIECAIGQRLVRKLCPGCKKEAPLAPEMEKKVRVALEQIANQPQALKFEDLHFYQAVGCADCGGLGYKGRIGIYEAISMNDEQQKLIQTPILTEGEIEKLALSQGSSLMLHDGIVKAAQGETTIEEVFRVAS